MKASAGTLVLTGFAGAVVAAVAGGMWLLDSPAVERARRLDQQRIGDLMALGRVIDVHVTRTNALPASLDAVTPALTAIETTRDPATREPYGYRPTGARRFELCATFDEPAAAPAVSAFWAHGAGRQCFTLEVDQATR